MKKNNSLVLSLWAYFGEYLLAIFLYVILFLVFDGANILSFIIRVSEDVFVKFTYIMLTASIGFYWVFYKESSSEFSKWLLKKDFYDTYSRVFLSTIAIYFLTLTLISITNLTKNQYITYLTGWFLILASINVFTFFRNIGELMRLKVYFNIKLEEAQKLKNS